MPSVDFGGHSRTHRSHIGDEAADAFKAERMNESMKADAWGGGLSLVFSVRSKWYLRAMAS